MHRLFTFLALSVVLLPVLFGASCAPSAKSDKVTVHMGEVAHLPAAMANAPARVRDSYRFAMANQSALQNVPCFCGCGPLGHKNNYDCYIKGTDADGKFIFDDHALGCQICVDISMDVMRFVKAGKAPDEIHAVIDKTFSARGPTNMP